MAHFDLVVTDAMLATVSKSLVLIDSYQIGYKKDKSEYIFGKVRKLRKTLGFKIWDAKLVSFFKENDLRRKYITVMFQGSEWNGTRDIVIKEVVPNETEDIDVSEFEAVLDYETLFKEFVNYINTKLEANWINVVNIAFNAVPNMNMYERFKVEYAGAAMHDALGGGLINHTMKMLRLYDTLEANDSRLKEYGNIIRAGIILHDLGKVEEMQNGVYQPDCFILNHRVRGIGYLERNRAKVLENIDEHQLARLQSIILTHHGGLGNSEICSTIYAYIVHLVDMCDSGITGVLDKLESVENLSKNSAGDRSMRVDDMNLII